MPNQRRGTGEQPIAFVGWDRATVLEGILVLVPGCVLMPALPFLADRHPIELGLAAVGAVAQLCFLVWVLVLRNRRFIELTDEALVIYRLQGPHTHVPWDSVTAVILSSDGAVVCSPICDVRIGPDYTEWYILLDEVIARLSHPNTSVPPIDAEAIRSRALLVRAATRDDNGLPRALFTSAAGSFALGLLALPGGLRLGLSSMQAQRLAMCCCFLLLEVALVRVLCRGALPDGAG